MTTAPKTRRKTATKTKAKAKTRRKAAPKKATAPASAAAETVILDDLPEDIQEAERPFDGGEIFDGNIGDDEGLIDDDQFGDYDEDGHMGARDIHGAVHGEVHGSHDADDADGDFIHEDWPNPWENGNKNLPDISPRPGFRQKWFRRDVVTDPDGTRMSQAQRQGWRPREANTVNPKEYQPVTKDEQSSGVIAVRDLILMEMPERIARKRDQFYADKQRKQEEAIKQRLDDAAGGAIRRQVRVRTNSRTPEV